MHDSALRIERRRARHIETHAVRAAYCVHSVTKRLAWLGSADAVKLPVALPTSAPAHKSRTVTDVLVDQLRSGTSLN